MARKRRLQPAAQRRAVHGRDHWLGRSFDRVQHVQQRRTLRRLAEFADIGAGNKSAPSANKHCGLNLVVFKNTVQPARQTIAHRGGKRVHRWRIERQDGDPVLHGQVGYGIDGGHVRCPLLLDWGGTCTSASGQARLLGWMPYARKKGPGVSPWALHLAPC